MAYIFKTQAVNRLVGLKSRSGADARQDEVRAMTIRFNSFSPEQFQILADQFEEKGNIRVAQKLRLISGMTPQNVFSLPTNHINIGCYKDVGRANQVFKILKTEYPKILAGINGDARAVLATEDGRKAVYGRVEGNGVGISHWTNRKSSKEAQQIIRNRIQQRADRQVAESARNVTGGKYLLMYQNRLNNFAVSVGKSYHKNISSLYTSSRAWVGLNTAGDVVWDNDAYSKSYGYGAKYKLAGVELEDNWIYVFTSRRTLKEAIPVPKNWWACRFHGLLDGDLWCIRAKKIGKTVVYNRFGMKRKKVVKTGVTCQIEVPEQLRKHWPASVDRSGIYEEHGENVTECKEAFRHKCRLAEELKTKQANSAKVERAKRLIVRLCQNLTVTHEHRKACGYCDAGTKAFLDRYGLSGRETVTLAELRKTGDSQALKPAYVAAEKLAEKLIAKVGA